MGMQLWERALDARRAEQAVVDIKRYSCTARRTRMNVAERRLAKRIADEHGIPLDAMLSKRRYPTLTGARDHFVAVLRWSTSLSLLEIGALVGRDHTSVLTAIRRYEDRLNTAVQS